MATMTCETSVKIGALSMVHLPLSLFGSLTQVSVSPCTKKLVAAAAVGAVSVFFLARHFRRRKPRKKAPFRQWEQAGLEFPPQASQNNKISQRITIPLNCKYCCSSDLVLPAEDDRKLSGSLLSLDSLSCEHSSNSSTCENQSTCWDQVGEGDSCSVVEAPATTPENLYLTGMDLFEEALKRGDEALTFQSKQGDDNVCASVINEAGDAVLEQSMENVISARFIHRLKSLQQRAYSLQKEFEEVLGLSVSSSHSSSHDKMADIMATEDLEDAFMMERTSSSHSFVSAVEDDDSGWESCATGVLDPQNTKPSEHRELSSALGLDRHTFYQEALQMAEDGKITCRVLRTEKLQCHGDKDFLAKLHCVREACQHIFCEKTARVFLAETGKKFLSSMIVQAEKSPRIFEEAFEEMVYFLEHTEHWENTAMELASQGVEHLNFYDIVLDLILMGVFEDLENPPLYIINLINNSWLDSSFKQTAVASYFWSLLKRRRQQLKVPDGFCAHFYTLCESISPVLAWGFLGPKGSLHDLCCVFKDQILHFIKDIFDMDKARYSSVESLAEDTLHLLHQCSEQLLEIREQTPCHITPMPQPQEDLG